MDSALVEKILSEIVNTERQYTREQKISKEYIQAKANLFHKYINYKEEFSEALYRSPYCFVVHFKDYFKVVHNKEVVIIGGCSNYNCNECCRHMLYDSLLKHINRIREE